MNIIELAKDAGFSIYDNERRAVEGEEKNLEAFAALVRAEALAEPVKQEPVAWWDTGYCVTMSRFEAGADWIPLYANTFDIEALTESRHKAFQSYVDQVKADRELSILQARLEALEEAAKVCETDELCCKCGDECAAAIRRLK